MRKPGRPRGTPERLPTWWLLLSVALKLKLITRRARAVGEK